MVKNKINKTNKIKKNNKLKLTLCCTSIIASKRSKRVGQLCGRPLKKGTYCGLHSPKKKCLGTTIKGLPCSKSAKKNKYCH